LKDIERNLELFQVDSIKAYGVKG